MAFIFQRALVAAAFSAGCLAAASPAVASAQADVAVVEVDPSTYTVSSWEARAAAAKSFFATHGDAYDFLVFFPAFPIDLSAQSEGELLGLHRTVRNDVSGIGEPAYDAGAFFGSGARLKGVIDVHSLVPGMVQDSGAAALATLAHEVAHQWSAGVSFRDPASGALSTKLLGADGIHWSYSLSSDASVMYGSKWTAQPNGTFVATESRKRYSPLDLYLMGILGAEEVPPFTLIEPAQGALVPANGLPPSDGTSLSGVGRTISIGDVIAAEGVRVPSAANSQKLFRAAFVILTPAGQAPTATQRSFVDGVRREWVNQFFFMTRGRGLMETDLVEAVGQPAIDPSTALGIDFLLAAQRPDGSWADALETSLRDSSAVVEALGPCATTPRVEAARAQGAGFLSGTQPGDNDSASRRYLALTSFSQWSDPIGLSMQNGDGGFGLSAGYGSTVIDSARAALAKVEDGSLGANSGLIAFLLSAQRADGGWPYLLGGPSSVEATAWVLRALASAPTSSETRFSARAGVVFLAAAQRPDGSIGDEDLGPASHTAEAVLALRAQESLWMIQKDAVADALLASQLADGSWGESVYETALALRVLREVLSPNIAIDSATLPVATATAGESVLARVTVENSGPYVVSGALLRAFASGGAPFGPAVNVPDLLPGQRVSLSLSLDTAGREGSSECFFVVDPDGLIEESDESDNRLAVALQIGGAPLRPDLVTLQGTLTSAPAALASLPAAATLSAVIGNLGQTETRSVLIEARVRGVSAGSTRLDLGPGARVPISIPVTIGAGAGNVPIEVVVDPGNEVDEAREDNNSVSSLIPAVPGIDVRISELRLAPAEPLQGSDIEVSFALSNHGTTDATVPVEVRMLAPDGRSVGVNLDPAVSVPAGASLARVAKLRAAVAGSATVTVAAPHPADLQPADNQASATTSVHAAPVPNLVLAPADLVVTPDPGLEGGELSIAATVHNDGGAASGPFAVDFWLGTPSTGRLLATLSVSELAAGASWTGSAAAQLENHADLAVTVIADSGSAVSEFDETDNAAVRSVSVRSRPDLVLSDGALELSSAFPRMGEVIQVKVTVLNAGQQGSAQTDVALAYFGEDGVERRIGVKPLPALDGGGSALVAFAWTASVEGPGALVATVNDAKSAPESNPNNNRAERPVLVQNGSVAVSNPYFSPNGDGVKDTTDIYWRLDSASEVQVDVIREATGEVVRTIVASGGAVVWDGRDESGRIARDARYVLSAKAAGSAWPIGSATAVLDTNRSLLYEAPQSMLDTENISSVAVDYYEETRWGFLPDDSGVVLSRAYTFNPSSGWVPGTYLQRFDGKPPIELPAAAYGFIVTADGTAIEYLAPQAIWSDGWYLWSSGISLRRLTLADLSEETLWEEDNNTQSWHPGLTPAALSPDGRTIAFFRLGNPVTGGDWTIERIDLDGSDHRVLSQYRDYDMGWSWPEELSFSPDGRAVYFVDSRRNVWRNDAESGDHQLVYAAAPQHESWIGEPDAALRHIWLPGSGEIALALQDPGIVAITPASGAVRSLVDAADLGVADGEFGYYGNLATDPWGESLAFPTGPPGLERWNAKGRYRVMLSAPPGAPPRTLYEAPIVDSEVDDMGWSTSGALMHFRQYGENTYEHFVVRSVGNLGTRLVAAQESGASGIVFRGTAADLNFERFEIVAGSTTESERRLVASGGVPVVNGELGSWAPPGPGVYEATLYAYDKAGNARERRTRFSWGDYSAIANIARDYEYISPNSDGIQDATTLSFSVLEPVTVTATISNASGATVRVLTGTYYEPQEASLAWGGLDNAGAAVPEGEYLIAFEGMKFRVVVDTIRPKVEFALLDNLRPNGRIQFSPAMGSGKTGPSGCADVQEINRTWEEVPQVFGNASWRVSDDNLLDWTLEFGRSGASEVAWRDSTQSLQQVQFPTPVVRGREVFVVGRDLAGNRAESQRETYDEDLFLLGFGPSELANPCIEEQGILELGYPSTYQTYPTPFKFLTRFNEAQASIPYYLPVGDRLLFVYSDTIGEPIVARAVAYRSTPGEMDNADAPFQYDYSVEDYHDVAVLWSAPQTSGDLDIYLVAIGASGTEYRSRTATFSPPPLVRVGLSGERHDQLLVYGIQGKYGEPVKASKGTVRLKGRPSGEVVERGIEGLEHAGGSLLWAFTLDASTLRECDYSVTVVGEYLDGRTYQGRAEVSLCGAYIQNVAIEGETSRVSLRETHRRQISSVRAEGKVGGNAVQVATWGPFEDDSPVGRVDLLELPLCQKNLVQLETQFVDGEVVSEAVNPDFRLCEKYVSSSHADGTESWEIYCDQHEPNVGTLCTAVSVHSWQHPPGFCSGAPPRLDVPVTGGSQSRLTSATATLETAFGNPVEPLALTGFEPDLTVNAVAQVPTSLLPDGTYLVRANVLAEDGTAASDVSTLDEAIEVEHVAPTAILTGPTAGSVLCPSSIIGPDGQVGRALAISGTVVEANLDSIDVLVKPPTAIEYTSYCKRTSTSRSDQVFSGSLCEIPFFGPGEYAARISARDRTGNETCSPEVIFRVPDDLEVLALAPTPKLFSPDGDGKSDVTTLAFQLTETAEVQMDALLPGQQRARVWAGTFVAGLANIDWAGTRLDGGPLPEGPLTLSVRAKGACGEEAESSIAVVIDRLPPVIRIDTPESGGVVSGDVAVVGSVLDPHLDGYEVSFKPASSGAFQIVEGASPGGVGVLATIPSQGLIAGDYVVRVRGWDSVGHSAFAERLFTWAPGAVLDGFAVLPPLVSPNGDGRFDSAIGTFALKVDANATIEILNVGGAVVATPLQGQAVVEGAHDVSFTAALSALADGDYRARVRASTGSMTAEAFAPIAVDRASPELAIGAPAAGTCVANALEVTGSVRDAHEAKWSLWLRGAGAEEVQLAGGLAPAEGALFTTPIVADGSYTLVLRGEDVVGNPGLVEVPFKSDSTPPQVALVSHADGAFISGKDGALEVAAEIIEENLVSWVIALDDGGAATHEIGGGVGTARPAAFWDVGAEPDGPVSVKVVAVDCVGRQVASLTQVVVDNTPPLAFISAPNGTYARAPLQILGSASDTNLESWRLEIATGAPGVAFGFTEVASGASDVDDSLLAELVSLPADGQSTLRLIVRDRAGNESESVASFFVDTKPPEPPVLVAQLQRPADAHLSWTASPSTDVVGYRVMRASAANPMEQVAAIPGAPLEYVDAGLRDGRWRYTVVAVDEAGLESAQSNEAAVDVDATPPIASISVPRSGGTVSGAVDVIGSAYGSDDLREYRLLVGEGAAPTSFSLVRRSPAAVRNDLLGTLDASTRADGSIWTLKLEAEDLAGNVASASVTVGVDNLPPGPPNLVNATAAVRDVTLTWVANTEPDLAGYLVYRNGLLVSGPPSALEDPVSGALPSTSTAWVDAAAPDGVFEYRIQAVDLAGNLSPLSNARTVTIELRAPTARIVSPVHLARVDGRVDVLATCDDADVASVQIEARAGQGAWAPVGPALTRVPWAGTLAPSLMASPVIELRAVAKDAAGKVDGNPASLHVFYDPPIDAPDVVARVDGNDVAVSWSEASPPSLIAGYELTADGDGVPAGLGTPTGTATASSSYGASLPTLAFDGKPATMWRALGALPQWWQLLLTRSALIDGISITPYSQSTFGVSVRMSGTWVPIRQGITCLGGNSCSVAIEPPLAAEGIRVEISSSSGVVGLKEVQLSAADLWTGTGPVAQSGWEGRHDYTVTARSRFGSAASGLVSALVYSPVLVAPPPVVSNSTLVIAGSNVPGEAQVTLAVAGIDGPTVVAGAGGAFSGDVVLETGVNQIAARAVDSLGNRSLWSAAVLTTYVPPPTSTVVLSLSGVAGSDVALQFEPSGDLSAVAGYRFSRDSGTGEMPVGEVAADARGFIDSAAPNGTHTYRVAAFNGAGFSGPSSNPVTATVSVALQPAPVLSVSVPPAGAALQLAWTFDGPTDACFVVERESSRDLFAAIASRICTTQFMDLGLSNGTEYRYRVRAVDAAGNEGAPSNIVAATPCDTQGPRAPRIVEPTTPGLPIVVAAVRSTIAGSSDAGTVVEVTHNGRFAGRVPADGVSVEPFALETQRWVARGFDVASATGLYAYSFDGPFGETGFAVEGPDGTPLAEVLTDVSLAAGPWISPTGEEVAFVGYGADEGVHVWNTALGTVSFVAVDPYSGASSAAWSTDGSRLAYLEYWSPASVVVREPTGELRRVCEGTWTGSVRWISDVEVAAIQDGTPSALAACNVETGVTRKVFEAYRVEAWASSLDGSLAVAALDANYVATLQLLAKDGAPPKVLGGSDGGVPSFSPDGAKIAWFDENGELVVASVAGGVPRAAGYQDWGGRLSWTVTSRMIFHREWAQPTILDVQGRFEVPVELEVGENWFSAIASDRYGNLSPRSEPINVRLDGEQLPDLGVSARIQPAIPVASSGASALVTIRNLGSIVSEPSDVDVWLERPEGRRSAPRVHVAAIQPGSQVVAVFPLDLHGLSGDQLLVAAVDPLRLNPDADRTNDRSELSFAVASSEGVSLILAAAPEEVEAGGSVSGVAQLVNPGPNASGVLTFAVLAGDGQLSQSLPSRQVSLAAASVTREVAEVPMGGLLAGPYQLRATFVPDAGAAVSAAASVTLLPETSAILRVVASRAEYLPAEAIELTSVVSNASRNAPLDGALLRIEVRDVAGSVAWTSDAQPLQMIWLGGEVVRATAIPAGLLAAGAYSVHGVVELNGTTIAVAQTSFSIAAQALLAGAVAVDAPGSPPAVKRGLPLPATATVRNVGTGPALDVAARLAVVNAQGVVVASYEVDLGDLQPGASGGVAAVVPTEALPLGLYGLALTSTLGGVTESLATARFRVADGLSPTLAFLNLSEGIFVRESVTVRVQANDDATGVASVAAAAAGIAGPLAMESGNPISGVWSGVVALPTDGPHLLRVSARDAEGNDGALTPGLLNPISVTVVRDTVPPEVSVTGVAEGALINHPAFPVVSATDLHLAGVETWLDGGSFSQGTSVVTDGDHVVRASAVDRAGNAANAALRFTIDQTPPTIAILGVGGGSYSASDVTPRIVVEDLHLEGYTATVDGSPFVEGVVLSDERAYQVAVEARDLAGNSSASSLTFTIDKTAPVIQVAGVSEGQWFRGAASPDVTFTDANLLATEITLDGVTFLPGTLVAAEGEHVLLAKAVDKAGNRAEQTVRFSIDASPPSIAILGVVDGAFASTDVAPRIVVDDLHLEGYTATLDGAPFVEGSVLSAERAYLLAVEAKDLAGNLSRKQVAFTIDKTAPVIRVAGVSEGQWFRGAASPDVTFTDANLATTEITLDGATFVPGTSVSAEGEHVLVGKAIDKAGNRAEQTVRFFIDLGAPVIEIAGVSNGDLVNHAVTPAVTVTDANLGSSETKLDGVISLPGSSVGGDGEHVVEVSASDLAGNPASARVVFEIDTVAPVIWASVQSGVTYPAPLTVSFSAEDLHYGDVTATMDGQPFTSGEVLMSGGAHALAVTARDLAGNEVVERFEFTIADDQELRLTKELMGRAGNVLAWVSDGCRTHSVETDRVRAFIRRSAPAGSIVHFAPDDADFRTHLRGGEFGVYIVATVPARGAPERGEDEGEQQGCAGVDHDDDCDDHEGHGGDGDDDGHEHEHDCAPGCRSLSRLTERELTEAVFRGAGLVVLKSGPNEVPALREASGVHVQGQEQEELVRLIESAFTQPGILAIGGGVELELEGGAPVGWFGETGDEVAVSAHQFGLGEALVFGFDLAAALPAEVASETFARAIGFAAGESELLPAGVVGVRIRVENSGGVAGYRLVETVAPELQVARVLDGGQQGASGAIEWTGEVAASEPDSLRYFIRLPVTPGAFDTTTQLFLTTGASERLVAEASLPLVLAGSRASLEGSAEAAIDRLPRTGPDGAVRRQLASALDELKMNTGSSAEAREEAIETLLDAADLAMQLRTVDPTPLRVAIDRLLAYWEMKP